MIVRLAQATETAHRLAEEHVKRQGVVGPDPDVWLDLMNAWQEKGGKRWTGARWVAETWEPIEVRCIMVYCAAALGYQEYMVSPGLQYGVPPNRRGLWDGGNRWGLVLTESEGGEAK